VTEFRRVLFRSDGAFDYLIECCVAQFYSQFSPSRYLFALR
jgi:hypothetical protein